MKVKELKELLSNIPDDLDVYAFGKKVESYGIWNVFTDNGIVTQFKLTGLKKRNWFLQKLKFWK